MSNYLIVGATGSLGGEICRRLVQRGESVKGLVRRSSAPERVEQLRSLGVEPVAGDLRDGSSLREALRGIDVVVSTATTIRSRQEGDSFTDSDERGHATLVDAAVYEGVSRFVYVSFSGNLGADDGLTRSKRATERKIRESGLRYSILRPSLFMEVWLSPLAGFDFHEGKVVLFGDGNQPVSWISAGDVAEFATMAAMSSGPSETIELGGPEAISRLDAVWLFEEQTGRSFRLQNVPLEVLENKATEATDEVSKTYASLQLSCARGDAVDTSDSLQRYPVTLTSVRDYARRVQGEEG